MSEVSKHVFLDYAEYQRLLEAKQRVQELISKVRELEAKIARFEKSGDGFSNLSALAAGKDNELETPIAKLTNSITFPPSATLKESDDVTKTRRKWYFLGIP